MDSLLPAGGAAIVISTILQMLKNNPRITLISRDTGQLNALLSVIAAGIAAFGLSYNYTYDAASGAFTLGFTGTVGGLVSGLAHWIGQWALQHGFYKGFIVPAEILGELRAMMAKAANAQPVIVPGPKPAA